MQPVQWNRRLGPHRRKLLSVLLGNWRGKSALSADQKGLQGTVTEEWAAEERWPLLELGREQLKRLQRDCHQPAGTAADLPRQTKPADSGVLVMLYMNLRAQVVPMELWGKLFAGGTPSAEVVGAGDHGDILRVKAACALSRKGLMQLSGVNVSLPGSS